MERKNGRVHWFILGRKINEIEAAKQWVYLSLKSGSGRAGRKTYMGKSFTLFDFKFVSFLQRYFNLLTFFMYLTYFLGFGIAKGRESILEPIRCYIGTCEGNTAFEDCRYY